MSGASGIHDPVAIEIRPASVFDDVKTMVGPKPPDANVCWCLSYRIPPKENRALVGPARGERVKQLIEQDPLGVLAYDGDEVVGWAAVAPRAGTTFARNRKIPHVDDLTVWSVWCISGERSSSPGSAVRPRSTVEDEPSSLSQTVDSATTARTVRRPLGRVHNPCPESSSQEAADPQRL